MSPLADIFLLLISAVIVFGGVMIMIRQAAAGKRVRAANAARRRAHLEAVAREQPRRLRQEQASLEEFLDRVNRVTSEDALDNLEESRADKKEMNQ